MKTGNRKFIGFLITVILYTAVLTTALVMKIGAISDLSAFAVQASIGYSGIAGLFFASNVAEHYSSVSSIPPNGVLGDRKTEGGDQSADINK